MTDQEIKRILMDLLEYSEPTKNQFEYEISESLIDLVLDGRLELMFTKRTISYRMTDEGKKYVENMGNVQK